MDSVSKKVLNSFLEHKTLSISQLSALHKLAIPTLAEIVNNLRQKGYLRIFSTNDDSAAPSVNTPLEITLEGRAAVEECALASKKKRWENVRYGITTAIAVAALIISIFK